MGVQDRDWHREWWRKRESGNGGELVPPKLLPRYISPQKKVVQWHPVLTVLATVAICFAVWALVRFVVHLHR